MNLRDKLKKVKVTESEGEGMPMNNAPPWDTGDDVPITWDAKELKRMNKRTLRDNYKRGVITKELYKIMLNRE